MPEACARGEVDADRFMREKENNNKQIEIYTAELQSCRSKEATVPGEKPDLLKRLEGKGDLTVTDLTKELVRQLVDAIYVYDGNRVEIVFKFQDGDIRSDRK